MSSRRDFLRVLGAAGVVRLGYPEPIAPRRRTPARLGKIGIQLYTVRNQLARDVEGTLSKLARIGFREVEFAGYPEGTARSLREILDRLHLTAPSSHVSLQALRADWDRTLDQAAVVGQRYIVVASINPAERKTLDDWKRIAGLFNKAGETARARGIALAYHNHDFEFTPIDGSLPYDVLLRETDPSLVGLELDLYWIAKGGRDPLQYFARWPGRFPLVHVKDMDATAQKYFAPVGKGTIDFARIFKQAQRAGIKHYFYEQDEVSGPPFQDIATSYAYLRALSY